MANQFTLGKNERLKSRKKIELLFAQGKKMSVGSFRVFFLFSPSAEPQAQMGAGVSARIFKRAVDRNRVKRLIRESWRLQKTALNQELKTHQKELHLFVIYQGKDMPVYADTLASVQTIIQQLIKRMTL